MNATTQTPPVEHSAWMRGRIAQCVRAAEAMGLDPHDSPSVVVWPLGSTGKPGTRQDRACDRCDYYVPTGQLLFPVVVPAARRMILAGGLCRGCLQREAVSSR